MNQYQQNASTTLSQYLEEINRTELLTPEQERELAERVRQGDEKARQHFIEANLRLVIFAAKQYGKRDPERMLDLIQEGNLGLFRAVERFDPERGNRFSTYAMYWIRQAIQRHLTREKEIRLPEHVAEEVKNLRQARHRLYQKLSRQPNSAELAREMGIKEERIHQLEEYSQSIVSLEQPIGSGEEDNTTLGDLLQDLETPQPEYIAGQHLLRSKVRHILTNLPPREAAILRIRFGLEDGIPHTLEEVAKEFNVTRERVRQIQNRGLQRIRENEMLPQQGNR